MSSILDGHGKDASQIDGDINKCYNIDNYFAPPIAYAHKDKIHPLFTHVLIDLEFKSPSIKSTDPLELDISSDNNVSKYDHMVTSDVDCLRATQTMIAESDFSIHNRNSADNSWRRLRRMHTITPTTFKSNDPSTMSPSMDYANNWIADVMIWVKITPWALMAIIGLWACLSSLSVFGPLVRLGSALNPGWRGYSTMSECYANIAATPGTIIAPFFRCIGENGSLLWFPFISGIMGVLYYLFTTITQYMTVSKFAKDNMTTIDDIKNVMTHVESTILNANNIGNNGKYRLMAKHSDAHSKFIKHLDDMCSKLQEIRNVLAPISLLSSSEWITNVGDIITTATRMTNDTGVHQCMMYSFGLVRHLERLRDIKLHPHMNKADFGATTDEHVSIINQTFGPIMAYSGAIVTEKTTAELDSNIMLTGPNASGKTTLLKTTMTNLIYTQQYGYGFYENCIMPYLYTRFQSYLNIQDSFGTDSLFQAEVRRCREIVDAATLIQTRQFCIFDELFTGTNQDESIRSSVKLLTAMTTKFSHVDFIATTHMNELCELLKPLADVANDGKKIKFMRMEVNTNNVEDAEKNTVTLVTPTYKLVPGINMVQGAGSVLYEFGL